MDKKKLQEFVSLAFAYRETATYLIKRYIAEHMPEHVTHHFSYLTQANGHTSVCCGCRETIFSLEAVGGKSSSVGAADPQAAEVRGSASSGGGESSDISGDSGAKKAA